MLFREELAIKVMRGEKTATRRLPKDNPRSPWFRIDCRYKPGYEFPVMGGFKRPAYCRAVVDRLAFEPLGAITQPQARAEGFNDVPAFFAKFEEINGAADPEMFVWVVEFHVKPGTEMPVPPPRAVAS